MRASVVTAALVAALVGYGSSVALVLAAAGALGATPAQTTSWLVVVCAAKAVGSAALSIRTATPVVLAWSTPGAALVAASHGFKFAEGTGAFLLAGALIALTGLIPALQRAVRAIPAALGAAMLAGVLLPIVMAAPTAVPLRPAVVVPVLVVFFAVRLWSPIWAVLAALVGGVALSVVLGVDALPAAAFDSPLPVFVAPAVRVSALVSLGIPLYLVTMASQNLPGFAVLQGAGYRPPVRAALVTTGGLSMGAALFGAHPISMAAITASICTEPSVHPDPGQRWRVGVAYAVWWALLGLASPFFVGALSVMPPELISTVAGVALLTPLLGSLVAALADAATRLAAVVTIVTGASGLAIVHIGAAFWGLLAGLVVLGSDRLALRVTPRLRLRLAALRRVAPTPGGPR